MLYIEKQRYVININWWRQVCVQDRKRHWKFFCEEVFFSKMGTSLPSAVLINNFNFPQLTGSTSSIIAMHITVQNEAPSAFPEYENLNQPTILASEKKQKKNIPVKWCDDFLSMIGIITSTKTVTINTIRKLNEKVYKNMRLRKSYRSNRPWAWNFEYNLLKTSSTIVIRIKCGKREKMKQNFGVPTILTWFEKILLIIFFFFSFDLMHRRI